MAKLPYQMDAANTVILVSIVLFVFIPFLHTSGLNSIIDSLLGRLLLIGFVLYGITLGPLPGVFSFLAVAAVFAERNRYRIYLARNSIISRGSVPTLGQVDMPHSVPASVDGGIPDEPWLKYPNLDSFLEGDGWNGLPVGESENEKNILESQLYPNDLQDKFYVETGLAPADPRA